MKYFLFILFLLFITPQSLHAHVLSRDKNVGGVIHIDPEDNPIINKPAHIYIDVKDTTNMFEVANCECFIEIERDGEKLAELPVNGSKQSLQTEYIFTEKGIYTVILNAESTNNSFESFRLTYIVRVDRSETVNSHNESADTSHMVHFVIIAGAFIFFLALILFNKLRHVRT